MIAKEEGDLFGTPLSDSEQKALADAKLLVKQTSEVLSLKNIGNLSAEEIVEQTDILNNAQNTVQTLEKKKKKKGLIAQRDAEAADAAERIARYRAGERFEFEQPMHIPSRVLESISISPMPKTEEELESASKSAVKGIKYTLDYLESELPASVEGSEAANKKRVEAKEKVKESEKNLSTAKVNLEKKQSELSEFASRYFDGLDLKGVREEADSAVEKHALENGNLGALKEEHEQLTAFRKLYDDAINENTQKIQQTERLMEARQQVGLDIESDPVYKRLQEQHVALTSERNRLLEERTTMEAAVSQEIAVNEARQAGAKIIAEHELGKSKDDNAVKLAREFESLVSGVHDASISVESAMAENDAAKKKVVELEDPSHYMREDHMQKVSDSLRVRTEQAISSAFDQGLITEDQANEFRERLGKIVDYGTVVEAPEQDLMGQQTASKEKSSEDRVKNYLKSKGFSDDDIESFVKNASPKLQEILQSKPVEIEIDTSGAEPKLEELEQDIQQVDQAIDNIGDKPVDVDTSQVQSRMQELVTYSSFADAPIGGHYLIDTKAYNKAERDAKAKVEQVKSELKPLKDKREELRQRSKDISSRMNQDDTGLTLTDEDIAEYDRLSEELRQLDAEIAVKEIELKDAEDAKSKATQELKDVRAHNRENKEWFEAQKSKEDSSTSTSSSRKETEGVKTVVEQVTPAAEELAGAISHVSSEASGVDDSKIEELESTVEDVRDAAVGAGDALEKLDDASDTPAATDDSQKPVDTGEKPDVYDYTDGFEEEFTKTSGLLDEEIKPEVDGSQANAELEKLQGNLEETTRDAHELEDAGKEALNAAGKVDDGKTPHTPPSTPPSTPPTPPSDDDGDKEGADDDSVKETIGEINALKQAYKDVTDLKMQLVGLNESSVEARKLTDELRAAEDHLESLKSTAKGDWTQDQIDDYDKFTKRQDTLLSLKNARFADKQTAADIKAVDNAVDELIKAEKDASKLRIKIDGLDENSALAKQLKSELADVEGFIDEIKSSLRMDKGASSLLNDKQAEKYAEAMKEVADETARAAAKAKDLAAKEDAKALADREADAKKIKDEYSKYGKGYTDLQKLGQKYKSIGSPNNISQTMTDYGHDYYNLTEAIKEYDKAVAESGANSQRAIDAYNKMKAAQDKLADSYNKAKNAVAVSKGKNKELQDNEKLLQQQQSLLLKMEAWRKSSSKLFESQSADAKELVEEYKRLEQAIKDCTDVTELKDLNVGFGDLKNKVKAAGFEGVSVIESMKNKFTEYARYAVASFGVMEVVQGLKMMAQEVLEVDTAMTGLLRVTEMTNSETEVMFDKMVSSAKEYGRTLTDTINATADWVRAGFDENTALGLAEVTAMYQNVSDLDYNEASENLLTSYRGFEKQLMSDYEGDTVAAVEHITDVLNELDNQYSVTSAGLGEGLARSASALQIAGNTFEESAA